MFVFENMAIVAIMVVTIMICTLVFGYVLTAMLGEWRTSRRARPFRR